MPDELLSLVKQNRALFWSVSDADLKRVSMNCIVETFLMYGSLANIRRLFDILGRSEVASIFYSQNKGRRTNYHPRTKHFFTTYFSRYVPTYSQP